MWGQYRCEGNPEHRGYMLNMARALHCSNAWADLEGDCTTRQHMRWADYSDELKEFNMLQWDGTYDDPMERDDRFTPCGLRQHFWEAHGSCEGNDYRYATNNGSSMPRFDERADAINCPFYEFCWQDLPWCESGHADFEKEDCRFTLNVRQ